MRVKEDLPYIDKPDIMSAEFRRLYNDRISTKSSNNKVNRKSLKTSERIEILKKTNYNCHVCGQKLDESDFQADHISPCSIGGDSEKENYVAACNLCNNYRWDYLPDEIKWIIKVGVWAKTQIEYETEIGKDISKSFIEHENNREQRRKHPRQALELNINDYPIREMIDYSKIQRKSKNDV